MIRLIILSFIIIITIILLCISVDAKNLHLESYYISTYCKGQTEVITKEGTRIDCVIDDRVQEYEFAKKPYEAIGQALYYGSLTGKSPEVVFILEDSKDKKYILRALRTIQFYQLPITIHVIEKGVYR